MLLISSIIISYGIFHLSIGTIQKGCELNLTGNGYEKNAPLVLESASVPALFSNGIVPMKIGSSKVLFCSGERNYLNQSIHIGIQSNSVQIHCDQMSKLRLDKGPEVDFRQMQCKYPIRGTVQDTNEICAPSGLMKIIGIRLLDSKLRSLIRICYNAQLGSTIYAQHELLGAQIKDASKSSFRPTFSIKGTPMDLAVSLVYKRSYQKVVFNRIFNSSVAANKYVNNRTFLARGHLAPDADFLLASWQYTTYYYVNTVPQWQTINAGNWNRAERMVRTFASKLNDTLQIVTGPYGILEMNGQQVYLVPDKRKLPIPKFVWKILYRPRTEEAIVLVVSNNPFETIQNPFICPNICKEYGWFIKVWTNSTSGFLHCCTYKEFQKIAPDIPDFRVKTVLSRN